MTTEDRRRRLLDDLATQTASIARATLERDITIAEAYACAASLREIAAAAGCSPETVRSTLLRNRVDIRPAGDNRRVQMVDSDQSRL